MSRRHNFILFAGCALIMVVLSSSAQDNKPDKATPVVDPDAATYSAEKIYSPPGAAKSVEIGEFYLKKKKYNGALSRFQEAVQENPAYAPAYLGLGHVYEKIGLKQKALDAYRKYLDALPSQKDALDAKEVQQAVARLEQQIKSPPPARHRRST
jgi:tetratricopeptide (TPR) repeat protein